MPTGATFDKSRVLPMYARCDEEGEVVILTFVDADGAAFPVTGKDFKLAVYRRPSSSSAVFTLEEGDGLDVDVNQLEIDLSAARAAQSPNTYFYRLWSEDEDSTWLNGPFTFHQGEFDGVNDPEDFTITIGGTDVTITITGGGGGGTVVNLVAGANISIDATDPTAPIIAVAADEALMAARNLDTKIPVETGGTTSTRQILEDWANAQAGDYTLALTDVSKTLYLSKGTAGTLTFPDNATIAIPVGSWGLVVRIGAGQYSFAASPGVTLVTSLGAVTDPGLDAEFKWVKTAANTFRIYNATPVTITSGDITTALGFTPSKDRTLGLITTTTSHTGNTSETKLGNSILIPAGTLGANDMLEITCFFSRASGSTTSVNRVRAHTLDQVSGATQIATVSQTTTQLTTGLQRRMYFKNSLSSQEIFNTTANTPDEMITTTVAISSLSIDFSLAQYIMVSVQLANSADSGAIRLFHIRLVKQ